MLLPISRLSPLGPIATGLVASRRILPFRSPIERIAASAAFHGAVSTMNSAKAAACAGVPARALPSSRRTTACVWLEVGFLTPKKISWAAFCAQAGPRGPPPLPAPMMGIRTVLILPFDRTAHRGELLLRPMARLGDLFHGCKQVAASSAKRPGDRGIAALLVR